MGSQRASCGLEFHHVNEISSILQESGKCGYDFICVPLVHPRFSREHLRGKARNREGAFARSDLLLSSSDWNSLVIGRLSYLSCIGCDSEDSQVRANAEASLTQELTYAAHLGLPAIILNLRSPNCVNLARIIYDKILQGVCYQIWIQVSMQAVHEQSYEYRSDKVSFTVRDDPWHWWNRLHSIADLEKKIGLALEVTADLPDRSALARWLGEPVRCAVLPTTLFMTNKKGFPVLSRAHQELIRELARLHSQFIFTGPMRHAHWKLYHQYLDYVVKSDPEPLVDFARGYEDFLQSPLQPLMDNLESQTYEVFEKDPIKYREYERAMILALQDKHSSQTSSKEIIIMVLGAGRGPLVRRALAAAHAVGCCIKVYAVEKNPNAVVTLQAQQEEDWGDAVTVVSCDMREWEAPEKADILVSELLGSFGDNELSPECLDGAQKFLKDDGISIPCSYTSYLCPIQSPKLYTEIRQSREKDKHYLAHFETPYVVYLHNKKELSPSQALFTFHHPNQGASIESKRYRSLQFPILDDSVVHGLAGYFEATLYKDVHLSIRPETHSKGMFSWFPILFPLKEPVSVNLGDILEVHFWRCAGKRNVWYEWCITSPTETSIHNPNGRAYTIGL